MTACVNKKSKRVAAVVTASLVGALSIGAPAVALATTDAGIDLLAVDWYTNAKVSKATDGKGNVVSDPTKATFEVGSGKYLVPTEVVNSLGDATDVTNATLTYTPESNNNSSKVNNEYTGLCYNAASPWTYKYVNASGKEVSFVYKGTLDAAQADAYFNGKLTDANGLKVNVKAEKFTVKTVLSGQSVDQVFKVGTPEVLSGVHAYVGEDGTSKDIYYNGSNLTNSIKFADEDGSELKGVIATWTTTNGASVSEVKNAGSYIATFTYEGNTYHVNVTVSALDLSKATIVAQDFTNGDRGSKLNTVAKFLGALEFNGTTLTLDDKDLDVYVAAMTKPDGSAADVSGSNDPFASAMATGKYTVTIADGKTSASNPAAGNVTGSAQVSFYVLDNDVVSADTVYYGNKAITSGTLTISLLDGESFDASKVSVKSGKTVYSGDQIELSFFKDGKSVDASELAKAGTSDQYTMFVRLKPVQDWESGAWTGGTESFTIKFQGTDLSADTDLGFYIDGENVGNSDDLTFDGTDLLKKLSVVVKADGKTYEQGKDYTLEVKSGDDEVTEAVNAGDYTIVVKPLTFKWDDDSAAPDYTFTLHVSPVTISRALADVSDVLFVADEKTGLIPEAGDQGKDNEFYVAYTGKGVTVPGMKYQVEKTKDGKTTYSYKTLDSSLFKVTTIKNSDDKVVSEAVDKGTYTVKVVLTDAAAKNYVLKDADYTFTIRAYGYFTDVESAEWYSVPVEKAYEEGYINGISGTNLFAPKADITRADAVCILFNMAGGVIGNSDFSYNENTGYETGFSDVDGHAYFAKALAWAKASGVANGSNGQFRPTDKITREEFVSLLANFAKSKGDYEAVDADEVLAGATDYTGWAKENVAWAKANGIMGNNGAALDGIGNITRAQVAAMAVNYQPENLTGFVRNDKGEMVKP